MVLTSRLGPLGGSEAFSFRERVREQGLAAKYGEFTADLGGETIRLDRTEGLQPPVTVDRAFLEQAAGACGAVREYLGSPEFIDGHIEPRLRQSTVSLLEEPIDSTDLASRVRQMFRAGYRPFLIYDALACDDGKGGVEPRLIEAQTAWGYVGYVADLVDAAVQSGIEPRGMRYHFGMDPSEALGQVKTWANTGGKPLYVMDFDPLTRSTKGDIIHLARTLGDELPLCLEDVVEDPATSLPAFRKRTPVGGRYQLTDEVVRPAHVICRSTPLDIQDLKAHLVSDRRKLELLHQFFTNTDAETTFYLHPLMYDLINKNHLGVLREALVRAGSPFAKQIGHTAIGGARAPFGAWVLKPDDGNSGKGVRHVLVVERGQWRVPPGGRLRRSDAEGGTVEEVPCGAVQTPGTYELDLGPAALPRSETVCVADPPGWLVPDGFNLQERYRPAVSEVDLPDDTTVDVQVEVRALSLPVARTGDEASVLMMVRLAPLRDGHGGIAHTNVRGGMGALDAIVESRIREGSLRSLAEVRDFFRRARCAGMMPCRVS